MNTQRVILIDANIERRAVWRAHLRQIPSCRLVTDVGDMARAPTLIRAGRPDVVIIGHELPDSGGIHLARRLSHEMPGLPVIVLAATARCHDVVAALRAGVVDFLIDPSPHEVRSVLAGLMPVADDTPAGTGQVFAVFSPKGGTGQTSLAANTAIALHQETGRTVAVVDLNGRHGQLDLQLDVYPSCSWLEAVGRGLPWQQALHPHRSGITLVVASRSADAVPAEAVQHLLQTLSRRFDYIVVDADHRAPSGTLAALRSAVAALIPVRLDLGGLRAAQLALQIAQEQRVPAERLRLVTLGSGLPGGLSPAAISEILKHPIAFGLPDDPVVAAAAIDRGVPVQLAEPDSLLASGVRGLVRELAGLTPMVVPESGGLQGLKQWLKRLTSRSAARTGGPPSRAHR